MFDWKIFDGLWRRIARIVWNAANAILVELAELHGKVDRMSQQDTALAAVVTQIQADVQQNQTEIAKAISLLQSSSSQTDPQVAAAITALQGVHTSITATNSTLQSAITPPALSVDQPSVTLSLASSPSAIVAVSGGTAPYTAASDTPADATVSPGADASHFSISAVAVGSAKVTITDATGATVDVAVTVTA